MNGMVPPAHVADAAPPTRRAPRIVRAAEPGAKLQVQCRCGEWTSCGALEPLSATCRGCGHLLKSRLSDRLLSIRRFRGFEQREVARRMHLHDSIYALWEAGRRPVPARWLEPLAAALQVPSSLLANDANPSMDLVRGNPGATRLEAKPLEQASPPIEPAGLGEPSSGGPAVSVEPRRRRALYTLEVSCLMCGRALGALISRSWPLAAVAAFQPCGGGPVQESVIWRRLRCGACGGNTWLGDVQCRWVEPKLDWSVDPPRRGRPPKRGPQVAADSATG